MEAILEKIRDFADLAHGMQLRKYTPERYIVHPVRVMQVLKSIPKITILAAALLHDVLEDTPVTKDEIRKFLSPLIGKQDTETTIKLVIELTDVYVKTNYPTLNRRERKLKETERMRNISAAAQTIKYADILDNSHEIIDQDTSFAPIYLKEVYQLLLVMKDGDPILHSLAMRTVEEGLKKIKKRR